MSNSQGENLVCAANSKEDVLIKNGVPKGWAIARLAELSSKISDGTHHTPTYTDKGIAFISVKDIREEKIHFDNCKYISEEEHNELIKRCHPEYLDVLITKSGTIGRVAVVKVRKPFSIFVSVALIKPSQFILNSHFLAFALKHYANSIDINQTITGGIIKNLYVKDLRQLFMPIPPLAEQRRIVAKIESLQARSRKAREALEAIPPLLEKFRQSVLAAAFRGDLTADWRAQNPDTEPAGKLLERIRKERRQCWEQAELEKMKAKGKTPKNDKWKAKYKEPEPVDTTNLPELPEGWCWTSVQQLGEINEQPVLTGPFGTNLGKDDFTNQGVPVLTIGCLTADGITLEKAVYITKTKAAELNRYKLCIEDLLFSRMASVGRAGIVDSSIAGCIFNYHIMRLRFCKNIVIPNLFVYYAQGSSVVRNYIKETNHGATRDGINTQQLLKMPFALPPYLEQKEILKRINVKLSKLAALRSIFQEGLTDLIKLDQSILSKAFRGELVSQDPNNEPASVLLERIKAERKSQKTRSSKSKNKKTGKA